jgi:hypothetical protein
MRMRITLVLCDAAQTVEGKLYILGGGWTHVLASPQLSLALAVVVAVPCEDANRRHPVSVSLKTEDAVDVVGVDAEGISQPIRSEGQFEIGRPPGIKAGSDLNATMVFKFGGLALEPGGYVWEFKVGATIERAPFWVVGAG